MFEPPSPGGALQPLWWERTSDLPRLQVVAPAQQQGDGSSQQLGAPQQQQNGSSASGGGNGTLAPPAPSPVAGPPALITDLWLSEGALGEAGMHLSDGCPLLARKLAPDNGTVQAWAQLLAADFGA